MTSSSNKNTNTNVVNSKVLEEISDTLASNIDILYNSFESGIRIAVTDENDSKSSTEIKNNFNGICATIQSTPHVNLSNPFKPFAWVVDHEGILSLNQFLPKTSSKNANHIPMLHFIGFEDEWIAKQLKRGIKFRILLFPRSSKIYTVYNATWNGIWQLIQKYEPEIYRKLQVKQFMHKMEITPFEDIQNSAAFSFLEIEGKKNHALYLTKEKFLKIEDGDLTLIDCRFFIYCYIGCNGFFSGNGYTADKDGKQCCKEYLVPNVKLKDISYLKIAYLNIEIIDEE